MIVADRYTAIDDAYEANAVGIVSTLETKTRAPDTRSVTTVQPVMTISAQINESNAPQLAAMTTTVKDDKSIPVQTQETPRTAGIPAFLTDLGGWQIANQPFRTQTVDTTVSKPQVISSALQAYAYPRAENAFGYNQAMAALNPETLRQKMMSLKLGNVAEIMASELAAMDLDIRNLQLNFVHTHLTAPIDGLITGIFKDLGESVEPGEPVVRIENDRSLLVVGRVQFQAPLWVGQAVLINIKSVFQDGTDRDLPGVLVAIRGHEAESDEWDVIIQCNNLTYENRLLLPLGYQFDPDRDTFSIVATL